MQVVFQTVIKYIREIFRDKGRLGILILTPIIFFSFFGFIFTSGGNEAVTLSIGIMNNDDTYNQDISSIIPAEYAEYSSTSSLSELFINLLQEDWSILVTTHFDIDISIYDTTDEIVDQIELGGLDLGVVIPNNFTVGILSGINQVTNTSLFPVDHIEKITLRTYGDPSISDFQTTSSIFEQALARYVDQFIGINVIADGEPSGGNLSYSETSISSTNDNPMDFFFPGFFTFLIILQAISVTSVLATEKEKKTIQRMKMSHLKTSELFLGYTIGQIIAFTLQFVLSVFILGFWGIKLNFSGLVNAYIISQLTNITIIGLSLIIASVVPDVQSASSVTGIGSAPLGFLSGSFIPMSEVWLIKSINLQFWDLIPTYHTTSALTKIMIDGVGIVDLIRPIIALIISSIMIYSIGIYLYNQYVIEHDT